MKPRGANAFFHVCNFVCCFVIEMLFSVTFEFADVNIAVFLVLLGPEFKY